MRRLMAIISHMLHAFGPAQKIEVMLHVRFRRFSDHNQSITFRRRRHRQIKQSNSLATEDIHESAKDNDIIFRVDRKQPFHTQFSPSWQSIISNPRVPDYTAQRSSRTSSSSRTTRGGSTIISASEDPGGTIG